MPSLRTTQADNPLTGAGIVRYFKEEKGIKVEPTVFIGITVAFVVLELVLNIL